MTQQDLQKIFESEFDWHNWKKVMNFVFPEFKFNLLQTDLARDTKAKEEKAGYIKVHGQGELASHEILMLCEVLVKDNIRLDRNVRSVRSLVAGEVIPNYQTVMAVFHNADNSKWRFTLVVKEFTSDHRAFDKKPDSYTYAFGIGEKGRTAAERFLKLSQKPVKTLKDLEEAFSVEALSKKFFREYKDIYQHFVADIISNPSRLALFKEPSKERQEKSARDFVKKMMGRVIFLYFLQKKGWLGCKTKWKDGNEQFMKTFVEKAEQNDNFYFQYLEPLFFDTLNEKRTKNDEDCIIQKTNFGKVPYLNGGLFEKGENHPTGLTLTWDIFKTFFDTLNNYNFTIIEDDPEFKEVAVDPEMLGHIFENLLEDNKDKGAYYTPKEIVHYMCQESLYEYLKTYLKQHNHWPTQEAEAQQLERSLQRFVKQKLASGVIDYDKALARALKEVKICDPAIGSGAFPMGLLNEIYHCVHKLHDESPDKVGDVWAIGKEWRGNKVKLNIIQNSIYGVDIEKGAVDIARLRFWLSLIIDEDRPKPLPNLDFKIVVGDSLLPKFENDVVMIDWNLRVDKYEGTAQSKNKKEIIKDQIENLNKVVEKQKEYFTTDESKKRKILNEIQILKLDVLLGQVKQELVKIGKQKEAFGQTGLFSSAQTKKQIDLQEQELKLKDIEKRINKKLAAKKTDFSHFDWKLDFPEILNNLLTDKPGFDIVIGNPPYVRQELIRKIKPELEKVYRVFNSKSDLYTYFYELTFNIAKSKGASIFITNNGWIRNKYGTKLRELLLEECKVIRIVNFEDEQQFDHAIVETNILLFKKENSKDNRVAFSNNLLGNDGSLVPQSSLLSSGFVLSNSDSLNLKSKIDSRGKKLCEWNITIQLGIRSGYNDAFVIDESKRKELLNKQHQSNKLIKKLIRGRDIGKYQLKYSSLYIIISKHKGHQELINDYPALTEHLSNYEAQLKGRGQVKNGQHHWLELDNGPTEKYFEAMELPKIIWLTISDKAKFYLDEDKHYINNAAYFITGSALWYITAFLNSKLIQWYFSLIGPSSGMGTIKWEKVYVERLPIPPSESSTKQKIENLAQEVQNSIRQGLGSEKLLLEIDCMVYKTFQLSLKEVIIIDPEFPLTEEEYNSIKID